MDTIITDENREKHVVEKYKFKNMHLKNNSAVNDDKEDSYYFEAQEEVVITPPPQQEDENGEIIPNQDNSQINQINNELLEEKNNMIESLLKKVDELSTSLIKIDMRMEKQQKHFDDTLKISKEESFKDGERKGHEEARNELEQEYQVVKKRAVDSINNLDLSSKKFAIVTASLENELVNVAIDVAQEVIKTEVELNSSKVAISLAQELMKQVKDASKITLKVNPTDFNFLKTNLVNDSKVEVISDNAIASGGIVILSDVGNIDGSIKARFSNVKSGVYEN